MLLHSRPGCDTLFIETHRERVLVMKKPIRSLLLALLLAGMLSACGAKTDTPQTQSEAASSEQESPADVPSDDEAEIDPADKRIFDPYALLSADDPFLSAMRDNPIDALVPQIMKDRQTTADMAEGLYAIYDLWTAEMESSLQKLLDAMENPDRKQQIIDAQAAWEAAADACIRADKEIIGNDGWATELTVKFPYARIQTYRERTILLKYLLYLYKDDNAALQFLPVEP